MESATILTPPSTGFCFPSEPNIAEGPEHDKKATLFRCTGRGFTNSVTETKTAVAISKLSGKTDPSEIQQTSYIRKQQACFY